MRTFPFLTRRLLPVAAICLAAFGRAIAGDAALSFDGTNDYVSTGIGLFPRVTDSFTIEFWANPTAPRSQTIEANGGVTGNGGQRYALFPENGQLAYGHATDACAGISVGINGVSVFEHSGDYLPSLLVYNASLTDWVHVAVVYSNRLTRLFLNGALVRTGSASAKTVHPGSNLGEMGLGYGYYQGVLSEVRLWKVALDASTLQAWLHRPVDATHPAYNSLIAYWHLDEGTGLIAGDSSEGRHTGNLVNGPEWTISDAPSGLLVVVTSPANEILGQSATLNGWVNPEGHPTSAWFEWGTTPYTESTAPQEAGSGQSAIAFPQPLTGLVPDTTYHFRCVASNETGLYLGTDKVFLTTGPPRAQTGPATITSWNSAVLYGTVNPTRQPTRAWFEWGTNLAYGNHTRMETLAAAGTDLSVSNALVMLVPGNQYHYRIVATNLSGVAVGFDRVLGTIPFSNSYASTPHEWLFSGSLAWGDFDRDGDLDLLATGSDATNADTLVFKNDTGVFTYVWSPWDGPVPGVAFGTGEWGDFDNDGDLDILLAGCSTAGSNSPGLCLLLRNQSGAFSNANITLPGLRKSTAAWADYDNDGFLDFVASGDTAYYYNPPIPTNIVCRNNGNGSFTILQAGLPAVFDGCVAWGDVDNDGQLDLVMMGNTGSNYLTRVYRNHHGVFTDIGASLPGVCCGTVAWGDYDNDGQLDLLLLGQTNANIQSVICRIYHNDEGVFTDIQANLKAVVEGAAAWGDLDGDGDLDLAVAGYNPLVSAAITRVYRNDAGVFTDIGDGLPGLSSAAVAWGDYDNDGRLDLAITGVNRWLQLYRNFSQPAANPVPVPTPPTGLAASVLSNGVAFYWNPGADPHTPVPGLTYNLRVEPVFGVSQIIAPQSDAVTGRRRLPRMGNAQHSLFATLTNLPIGVYRWSVQTVNHSFIGSAWAPEQSFTITSGPPVFATLPASNVLCCSALLNGVVTPAGLPTSAWFEWGTNTGLGNTTSPTDVGDGVLPQLVSQPLSTLQPLTTYFFRLVATNANGLAFGTNLCFTTRLLAPAVSTLGASNVTDAGATLFGGAPAFNAPADYFIEWGPTAGYGRMDQAAILSGALRFDGVDDLVSIGSGKYPDITNEFTIELWASPAASRAETPEAAGGITGTSGQRYAILPDQGEAGYGDAAHAGVGLSIGTNGVSVMEHTSGFLPSVLVHTGALSGWTHVAVAYSGHVPLLYLDGILRRAGRVSTMIVHPSANLGGSPYGWYAGSIQDVRIWDVALPQATIQAWMNLEITPAHPAFTHLQGYWPMKDGRGPTVADVSPNVNSGQLVNGAYWTGGHALASILFSAQPGSLIPGTTYHFRAVATNPGGTAFGADQSFITLPLPRVIGLRIEAGPSYLLQFSGIPDHHYALEASTNLLTWTILTNLVAGAEGLFEFLDTGATNLPTRFYRLNVP